MKKFLSLTLVTVLVLSLSMVSIALEKDVEGEIDVMLWSGDGSFIKDIGHQDLAPEDLGGQNQAAVYAAAKAFNEIYPNIKINVYAKIDGPDDEAGSWYQHRENFKNEHGRWPAIFPSTDLAGDVGRGLVADLSRFEDDPLYQSFNESIMEMMNYYGMQAGLPHYLLPWGVFINKELAENNNIDVPNYDWTMNDYMRFIRQAPGGESFYGAMDANFSFFNTGATTLHRQLANYDGEGPYVDINSPEVRDLISTYWSDMAKNSIWPVTEAGLLPDGYGDSFGWWSHTAFVNNKVLVNDGDPWMMGDAAVPNPDNPNSILSNDWDIYPRPATPYLPNTVGVVLDPLAIHNFALDDGDVELSEEEARKIEIAYTFAAFWVGDTRSWEAQAKQLFDDNGVFRPALDDSLPLVTGDGFDEQMDIWYSTENHQRFANRHLMPGFHYVLELWEQGQVWDISDKAYPMYYTDEGGNRMMNLYEFNSTHEEDIRAVLGLSDAGRLDPQFAEKVLAKLPEWNELANERFAAGYRELQEALIDYYNFSSGDF